MATDPKLFVAVARAFISLNLEDTGVEMFKKADPLLSDEEKPPDLLFLLGQDLFEQEKFNGALKKLNLLIEDYPGNNFALHAYQLKGSIFLKQKKYQSAAEMFTAALRYPLTQCEKLRILVDKASVLSKSHFRKEALEVVNEADGLKRPCSTSGHGIYQEIGDLYFHLEAVQQAADVFKQAAEIANEQADKIALMLKVAECYRLLDKKEEFLALNEQISNLDDPFWSNLAKERMEEINFNWEMRKTEFDWKRGEKI
jgi:tetratricopeptide (TPR) repeat protein